MHLSAEGMHMNNVNFYSRSNIYSMHQGNEQNEFSKRYAVIHVAPCMALWVNMLNSVTLPP